jgi:hypothetical protein
MGGGESLGTAAAMLSPAAEGASEIVTGVVDCTSTAPHSATMNGTNGVIERELVCTRRPAGGG